MRELAPAARGSQDAGSRNLVFTFQLSTVVMPQLWMGFATRIGLGAPCMFRPLIRKAGKVPKEAGLDAGAGDENGGGEVFTESPPRSTKRCTIAIGPAVQKYYFQFDLGSF